MMRTLPITKKTGGNSPHSLVSVPASLGRQKMSLKLGGLPRGQSAPDVVVDEIVFDLKQAIKILIALEIRPLYAFLFRLRHAIAEEVSA
jgi:hypothetical protein